MRSMRLFLALVLTIQTLLARAAGAAQAQAPPCTEWLTNMVKTTKRIFSQVQQDGILEVIFDKIGTTNKVFAEFGFGYMGQNVISTESDMDHAASGLNTRNLAKQGWTGVYFDALVENKKFNITKAVLTYENIAEAFAGAKVPLAADYVSIDVDSVDIWLLLGLLQNGYRPRVISIEFNVNLGRSFIVHEKTWHAWMVNSVYGTSAGAVELVAKMFNYHIVHVMPGGFDIFLVRNDVISTVCDIKTVPSLEAQTPFLPFRMHPTAGMADLKRFVDFPLALIGDVKGAHSKALKDLHHIDETHFRSDKIGPAGSYSVNPK